MLDYPVLAKKPEITIYRDGERFDMIDLLAKTYISPDRQTGKYITVTKEYIARPDLVSLAVYGKDDYADLICKANNLSNPFELNEGMILFIPLQESLNENVPIKGTKSELVNPKSKLNSNGNNDNIFKEFSTSLLSNSRLKQLINEDISKNKDSNVSTIGKTNPIVKKMKSERRSPAEQTVEDENYIIDKSLGIVIY